MFQRMFKDAKAGWLVDDDETDSKTGEVEQMSAQQMINVNKESDKISLYKHSIFTKQPMSAKLEKMMYPDNPKFLDGKIEIIIPKKWPYDNGYHGDASNPPASA